MNLDIRRAAPDEAGTLTQIALSAKRYWGYPERWIELWTPLLTITPEFISGAEVWVAEVNGDLAGFYALIFAEPRVNLEHLWILPAQMGQGIGRALFQHALQRCRENHYQVLEIVSDPNAQGFYERMGAQKVGVSLGEVDGELRSLPLMQIRL
ncbi:MAG TPA: GNAT family N-acetyltransferase [Anaerolineales bacterium]|nr:GNAT family N-acetyltransferase [Anaerolineales bacterium]